MVGGIMCPDCGGVVGATESTEEGDPCRCFTSAGSTAVDSSEDVQAAPKAPILKVCRICAKDLNGHRRIRDNGSYLCHDCHKAEEKRLNYGRIRCGACGHLTKEENLKDYEGTNICPTCYEEKISLKKARLAVIGVKGARTRYEVKQLYILLAVLGFLLLVIVIGIKLHGHHS